MNFLCACDKKLLQFIFIWVIMNTALGHNGHMAELVDAPVSGTGGSNTLEVRVFLCPPKLKSGKKFPIFYFVRVRLIIFARLSNVLRFLLVTAILAKKNIPDFLDFVPPFFTGVVGVVFVGVTLGFTRFMDFV